jgi:DNA-binding transcriptional regulator YdaS (Cro superfamily)
MDLSTYITDSAVRDQLAKECGTSSAYLWQVASSWRGRQASVALAKKIEVATNGAVTRRDLRPDVYGDEPVKQKRIA